MDATTYQQDLSSFARHEEFCACNIYIFSMELNVKERPGSLAR